MENWDANPQPNAGSGMSITTAFENEADRVELQQGDVVKLTATVTTTGEGNYVQIEIPIPAGCGYVNKNERRGYEVHREYFYDRVVIFCERLPKGTHHFTVELQPRFKGVYTVNPAKVELMYFPTFSGNNSKKEVRIVEKQP